MTKQLIYIGIDPGKKGSICILEDEDFTIIPTPMYNLSKTVTKHGVKKTNNKHEYDIPGMRDIIEKYYSECLLCVIEKAQAMPGQGVTSMFSVGKGYGIWLGLLTSYGLPYIEIHPLTWTKKMFNGQGGEGKERNYMRARQLFPRWEPKFAYEKEYADSLLLAKYGKDYC